MPNKKSKKIRDILGYFVNDITNLTNNEAERVSLRKKTKVNTSKYWVTETNNNSVILRTNGSKKNVSDFVNSLAVWYSDGLLIPQTGLLGKEENELINVTEVRVADQRFVFRIQDGNLSLDYFGPPILLNFARYHPVQNEIYSILEKNIQKLSKLPRKIKNKLKNVKYSGKIIYTPENFNNRFKTEVNKQFYREWQPKQSVSNSLPIYDQGTRFKKIMDQI